MQLPLQCYQEQLGGAMSNDDCLFCKFVSGEIPVAKLAENEGAIAFADINPQAPVHVLVIPKRHVADVTQLSAHPDELQHVMELAAKVANQHDLVGGYRLVFNTGADAGQSVFHAHAHVLGGRSLQWPPG